MATKTDLYGLSITIPQALARAVKKNAGKIVLSGDVNSFRFGLWVERTPKHYMLQRGFRQYCIEIFAATTHDGYDFATELLRFTRAVRKTTNLPIYYHCSLPSVELALSKHGWEVIPQPKKDFTVMRLAPPVDEYALVRMGDKVLADLPLSKPERRPVRVGMR